MFTFTQERWKKLDTHINKERAGQLHLILPLEHIGEFIGFINNPLEDKEGIFRLRFVGKVQINFVGCSIERTDGEDVFTIKVENFEYLEFDE